MISRGTGFRLVLTSLVLFAAGQLFTPPQPSWAGIGCHLYEGRRPSSTGIARCVSSSTWNCYECEYSSGDGYMRCAEYPDGTSPDCIPLDYRDLPPPSWTW